MMNNTFQQQSFEQPTGPLSTNHGGHELFDVHEVLSTAIGGLNQCVLLREHIQDPQLLAIMDRQYAFMMDEYNITVECYKTGHDPKHPTRTYNMQMDNQFSYGISPSEPKKPMQAANELDDSIIAGYLLSMHKAGAKAKTAAALEVCNPVLRRVLQDSIPNCIEMAYEVSLYQNKKGDYQVPQLASSDMQAMLNMYGQGQMAKNMPN